MLISCQHIFKAQTEEEYLGVLEESNISDRDREEAIRNITFDLEDVKSITEYENPYNYYRNPKPKSMVNFKDGSDLLILVPYTHIVKMWEQHKMMKSLIKFN